MIGLSGAYLCFPDVFQALADALEPPRDDFAERIGDRVLYWLAYLHFGRINGIGIPCSGPGLCDQATKEKVTRRWSEYFPKGMAMGDSDRAHLDPPAP